MTVLTDWIKRQNPPIFCLQETHPHFNIWQHLRVKGGQIGPGTKQASLSQDLTKQTSIRNYSEDKEGHFNLIKGTVNQEDSTILSMYLSNSEIPNIIKNLLLELKTQIDPCPLIVGDFNTPFSPIDKSSGQKQTEKHQN